MMINYPIVSADSHAEEPDNLYDRLAPEYRARRPHLETVKGLRYLVVEGQMPVLIDTPNPLTEEDRRKEFRQGQEIGVGFNREGGIDIPLRLADLEEDNISAEIIYPNGIFKVFSSPDPELQMAIARLYNDFFKEVFLGRPEKFIPSAVIPTVDPEEAVAETKRCVRIGYRSISVPVSRPPKPYNLPDYESFWASIEELRLPISFHVFTTGGPETEGKPLNYRTQEEAYGRDLFLMVLGMAEAMSPLTMLTAAGVLDRHPDFKFVLVECGIGWLAWVLYAMDDVSRRRHMWQNPRLKMLPSEYFKRQGYITFGDDLIGLYNKEFTGVDCLMWGSDYPHDEGTFPHSRKVIEETFGHIPEEDKEKIVGKNAARLYDISLS